MKHLFGTLTFIALFCSTLIFAQNTTGQGHVVKCPVDDSGMILAYQYRYNKDYNDKYLQSTESNIRQGWTLQKTTEFVACSNPGDIPADPSTEAEYPLKPIYQYIAPDNLIGQNKFILKDVKSFGKGWKRADKDPIFYLFKEKLPGLVEVNIFHFTYPETGYAEIYAAGDKDTIATPKGWHKSNRILGYTIPLKEYERRVDDIFINPAKLLSLRNVVCLKWDKSQSVLSIDDTCNLKNDEQLWTADGTLIKNKSSGGCLNFANQSFTVETCNNQSPNQQISLRKSGRLVNTGLGCLVAPTGTATTWTLDGTCDGDHAASEVWSATLAGDFVMATASDPQLGYCQSIYCQKKIRCPNSNSFPCNDNNEFEASIEVNKQHRKSQVNLGKSLNTSYLSFQGVIMNGDLAHTNRSNQWKEFDKIYQPNNNWVYLGLGNHDIEATYNEGNTDPFDHLQASVDRMKYYVYLPDFDWHQYDGGYRGSLAYFWDIGDYRFIQLNSRPDFSKNFDDYDILEGWKFLEWVLGLTSSKEKNIILNMHRLLDTSTMGLNLPGYTRLAGILGNHNNIRAIFAGHLHARVGWDVQRGYTDNNNPQTTYLCQTPRQWVLMGAPYRTVVATGTPARDVPVLFGGGAECAHYLQVTFRNSYLEAQPIDSKNGHVTPVGTVVRVKMTP